MYWDAVSKTYVPVPGGTSADAQPVAMTAEDQAILSNPAADAPLEMKKPSLPPNTGAAAASAPEPLPASSATPEKKEDDDASKKDKERDNKDEKPRSLAAVKVTLRLRCWWGFIRSFKRESWVCNEGH